MEALAHADINHSSAVFDSGGGQEIVVTPEVLSMQYQQQQLPPPVPAARTADNPAVVLSVKELGSVAAGSDRYSGAEEELGYRRHAAYRPQDAADRIATSSEGNNVGYYGGTVDGYGAGHGDLLYGGPPDMTTLGGYNNGVGLADITTAAVGYNDAVVGNSSDVTTVVGYSGPRSGPRRQNEADAPEDGDESGIGSESSNGSSGSGSPRRARRRSAAGGSPRQGRHGSGGSSSGSGGSPPRRSCLPSIIPGQMMTRVPSLSQVTIVRLF